MRNILIATILLWSTSSMSAALTPEDDAFIDYLDAFCGQPVLIGPPVPPQFKGILSQAKIGCVARYGMQLPCLAQFTTIKSLDGSYKFTANCGPMPPEPTPSEGLRVQ